MSNSNELDVIRPEQVQAQHFAGNEVRPAHGTADTAMAAAIKAQVEARYIVAMNRPRDLDQVRERVLKECRRPRFAEGAMWVLPRGGKNIDGLSIRFAEAAARCFTNLNCEVYAIYDDAQKRILRVAVSDVESNESFSRDLTLSKTVERTHIRQGQAVLGTRTNSQGRTTYLVAATEDELSAKEGSMISKAIRTQLLRIIPGWLQDEAKEVIRQTLRDAASEDPDTHKRRVLDAFNAMGITTSAIKEYLGRDVLEMLPPDEIADLRGLYSAIRDGHVKWATALAERRALHAQPGPESDPDADADAPLAPATKAAMAQLDKIKHRTHDASASKTQAQPWEKHPPKGEHADDQAARGEPG